MSGSINPVRGSLKAAASALADPTAPVTMINLLRFSDEAHYEEGQDGLRECSGRDAYATYLRHANPKVAAAGASLVYHGNVHALLIAPDDECWDEILIIRYPNYQAFTTMVTDPEYQKITHHRTAALADSRLWATQEP